MNVKTLNLKYVLCCCLALFLCSNSTFAQKKTKKEKPKKEQSVKPASSKANSPAAVAVQLSGMSREEKNTMTRCPLHGKHMELSDNYRADASDYTTAEGYPFAYQLNYRRYCKVCTKVMNKDEKQYSEKVKARNGKGATFERCEVHNAQLNNNPDYDPQNKEGNPNMQEMPHARQYHYSTYCKICTKVNRIQEKTEQKAEGK